MARFRLRFQLQEIDLPEGETLLGRSVSCNITVEDPLVSRKHARIVVREDVATLEDLGSRNGVVVAGRPVFGVVDVSSGARIRIGTQELVLSRTSEEATAPQRGTITGFMIHCGGCGFPFASEHTVCPHCGSSARNEDATLSGSSKEAWSLELVAETVQRAEELGRWEDVERVLLQARRLFDEIVRSAQPVSRKCLDELAGSAVALSLERGQADWGCWALGIYAAQGLVPPRALARTLGALPAEERVTLVPIAEQILKSAAHSASQHSAPRHSTARPKALRTQQPLSARTAGAPPGAGTAEADELDLETVRVLAGRSAEDDESPRGAGMAG